jgi:hypothetical protein
MSTAKRNARCAICGRTCLSPPVMAAAAIAKAVSVSELHQRTSPLERIERTGNARFRAVA